MKKKILNICMVLVVLLMIAGGIVTVGSVKGWFEKETTSDITVSEKTGIAKIERNGVAFEVDRDTTVRAGDKLYTQKGATLTISEEDTARIYMNSDAEISVESIGDTIEFEVLKGEVLVDAREWKNVTAISGEAEIYMKDAVISISTQTGSGEIPVYSGKIDVKDKKSEEAVTAKSGQVVSIVENSGYEVSKLKVSSLNDFIIQQLAKCDIDESFCFTKADLKAVQKERENEILKAQQELLEKNESASDEEETGTANRNEIAENLDNGEGEKVAENGTNPGSNEAATNSGNGQTTSESGGETQTENTPPSQTVEQPETHAKYCTIEIRCDTILNNMQNLTPGLEGYVPSNGTVLGTSKIEFTEGETVFDVLKRACDSAGIQIEYSYTPIYESYYIEGINHLYEFDCGNESGWMYKVNGWFPNYGCSSYTVQEGDTIVWCYTCNGLGADVGGGM